MLNVCYVAGCKAERLACSNTYVYVLDTSSELVVRLAVESPNKQWHKVPGALNAIAGNNLALLLIIIIIIITTIFIVLSS